MNSTNLVGRLTQDPEARTSKNGETKYATFGLAVNDRYGEKDRATFINVTAFGKLADVLIQHKHKGDQIGVTGRLTTSDGFKDLRVVADRVEFLALELSRFQ